MLSLLRCTQHHGSRVVSYYYGQILKYVAIPHTKKTKQTKKSPPHLVSIDKNSPFFLKPDESQMTTDVLSVSTGSLILNGTISYGYPWQAYSCYRM